jgi:glycerol-3-phosphate O-acyltransferase
VMNEVNRVTAVTPSALVAAALLTHGKRGIAHGDLVLSCERLAGILRSQHARFAPSLLASREPFVMRKEAIREACELLQRAGHVESQRPGAPIGDADRKMRPGHDAIYVVPDAARLSLDIAKNLVVHFFLSRAMIATPLACSPDGDPMAPAHLAEHAQFLSRLFKYEFQFRADATFETIFGETVADMEAAGELARDDAGNVGLVAGGEGRERALVHARMVRSFLEGYRVAARGLTSLLKGGLSPKDLVKRSMTAGERMFLAGEIECREAVNRPVLENALLAFVDQGYLRRDDGKYVLPSSFDTADAVRTIEARIAAYL